MSRVVLSFQIPKFNLKVMAKFLLKQRVFKELDKVDILGLILPPFLEIAGEIVQEFSLAAGNFLKMLLLLFGNQTKLLSQNIKIVF